ncbi:MAG: 30S ribosomal protein S13 [Candidatus Thermoplasmatota archaeon]|nr:30S ribosomal protein S13 [Candidatus Thermoplasmatota archaeon]
MAEKKGKQAKPETKKELPKRGSDFKYIVRIANTDINGEKSLVYGLTTIKGIGRHMGTMIADLAGLDRMMKIGDLKDDQIEKIKEILEKVNKLGPKWMLNHRKDYETAEDLHLIGVDIDARLREEINIMKKIRSYKGVRHEAGLPVRGQRTRAHGRVGLALGVSRKAAREATASKEKEKGKSKE